MVFIVTGICISSIHSKKHFAVALVVKGIDITCSKALAEIQPETNHSSSLTAGERLVITRLPLGQSQ